MEQDVKSYDTSDVIEQVSHLLELFEVPIVVGSLVGTEVIVRWRCDGEVNLDAFFLHLTHAVYAIFAI